MEKGTQSEICPSQPTDSLLAVYTDRMLGDEADGKMNFEEVSQQRPVTSLRKDHQTIAP